MRITTRLRNLAMTTELGRNGEVIINQDKCLRLLRNANCPAKVQPPTTSQSASKKPLPVTHLELTSTNGDLVLSNEESYVDDVDILEANLSDLESCPYYYGAMDMTEARQRLANAEPGTFLLRNSSDSRHWLTLSVRTSRGTTSVRIVFQNGLFHLDCEKKSRRRMPNFRRVLDLIQYYVDSSVTGGDSRRRRCMLLEDSGRSDTPVMLIRPSLNRVCSLKHLSRQSVQSMNLSTRLALVNTLPVPLQHYIHEHPYSV